MTGRGRGLCVVRLPRTAGEPVEGVAGIAGRPFRVVPDARRAGVALLRRHVGALERELRAARAHIDALRPRG